MRRFLLFLIIIVIGAIALVASPLFDVKQTDAGRLPQVESEDGNIIASPGEPPSFEVETGTMTIGDADDEEEQSSAGQAGNTL